MYFFLSHLFFVDICFTSTTIPKMLLSIQTQSSVITYAGCISQMYFFILFAGLDIFLLTMMTYDQYVAICHPLHYMVIINPQLCGVVLALMVPLNFICISYGFIVHTILRILSSEGKQNAFSICISHLTVVVVYYDCVAFVYLRPSSKYLTSKERLVTVTYTIVTPLLNPMV
ncbi:Olfactory Receptor 7A5 [Manis pentadactyla]|nr:Olfactory Receptor 7A5 [Manis pentadactyla]